MKYRNLPVRRFVAVLIGIFLLCTGLLKLMDPEGTRLIVTEYCKFFHLRFLIPAAKVLGMVLSLLESALGVALITGIARRVSAWATYILLGFFTLITFILWRANPEMDCGCFGEAYHLTHLQSLLKNVVLLLLAVFAFTPMSSLDTPRTRRQVAAWVAWVSLVVALVYCNRHIPLVDFTDYKPGTVLFASDNAASSPVRDSYRPSYVYEKDGRQETFTLENLPDSSWTFVKVDTLRRRSLGHRAENPVLSFRDAQGDYQDALAARDQAVVFSVYEPDRAPWDKIRERFDAVQRSGARPLLLLTALPSEEAALEGLPAYFADYRTLISLNRDNGGATYFYEGELVAKWGVRDFPKHLSDVLADDPVDLSTHVAARKRILAQGFCVYLGAVLILL